MQQASERGGAGLVYFAFDLLEIEGDNLMALPLSERKSRLASLLTKPPNGLKFSDHEGGDGEAFAEQPIDTASKASSAGRTRKGPTRFWALLLLGFHDDDGGLQYAGRVSTGMSQRPPSPSPQAAEDKPAREVRRETPG